MEASRNLDTLAFSIWQPFVWEYTSAISALILIPAVSFLLQRCPLSWAKIVRSLTVYFCAAVIFSICHVILMVAMRKLIYLMVGMRYQFGPLPFEFIYELRKDLWSFAIILIVIYGYRFIVRRLIAEADLISEGEDTAPDATPRDRFLVKKMGREFIVKLDDVEWMESSGNYVNLHIKERIYPIRKTLSALTEEIAGKGFCRVHRSHAINLDSVESIASLPSGDGEVTLKSGKILNISRRYKDELKQRLI